MTSLEEEFYRDIRKHREDDMPRLVLADWLDEQGDEVSCARAELIRVQCRLAQLPAEEEVLRPQLVRQEGLLQDQLTDWLTPVQQRCTSFELRRGLIEEITVQPHQLLGDGEALLELAPVAELVLSAQRQEWEPICACPALRAVTRLEGRGGVGDEGMRALADSPHTGRLRALLLHHSSITEEGFADLLRLDLSQLTHLNLGANNLHDTGMEMLCFSAMLTGLRYLSLGANELYGRSARALAESPYLYRLDEINLGANYLDDTALGLIAEAPHLASLRILDVRSNEFGMRGAEALAQSPHLEHLTSLDASGNKFGARGAALLRRRFGGRVNL
ncbi:MAG: TIGR02996 domain-containing protein [Gemmataceae bacterium]